MFDLSEAQQELADRLGIEKKEDVADIWMRFYHYVNGLDGLVLIDCNPRFPSSYSLL